MTIDLIAAKFFTSKSSAYVRIRKLDDLKLLERHSWAISAPEAIRLTRAGAAFADTGLSPADFVGSQIRHSLAAVELLEALAHRHPDAELVTERQLSAIGLGYASGAQRARVMTEAWAGSHLYCAACESDIVTAVPNNTAVYDFTCPGCAATYQLKSQAKPIGDRVLDAAYGTMMEHIVAGRTPNLWVMHYELPTWTVSNLLLVPSFAFSASAIEARKPLSTNASRAGWVGCNIVLRNIPVDGRIPLVAAKRWCVRREVRASFARIRALATGDADSRGWTLDVLAAVREMGLDEFSLADVYAHQGRLQNLHPNNHHVQAKIRQQLQVLRDNGLIRFLGRGRYGTVPRDSLLSSEVAAQSGRLAAHDSRS